MRSSAESSEAESIRILSAMADGGGNLAGCPSGDFSDKFDATPGKVSQEKEWEPLENLDVSSVEVVPLQYRID